MLQTLTMPGPDSPGTPGDVGIGDRGQLLEPAWPRAAFIEHKLAGDPTKWWAADPACVEAMARSAGLRIADRPAHEFWICEREEAADHGRDLRLAELRAATRQRASGSRPPSAASRSVDAAGVRQVRRHHDRVAGGPPPPAPAPPPSAPGR